MLSILIPVYNRSVAPLVAALSQQCGKLPIAWEIIIADDGSTHFTEVNAGIDTSENVTYHAFRQNIGRSAIRNRLGEMAKFENLLYLDCDSMPVSDAFVETYMRYADHQTAVYGGTVYKKPASTNQLLHYLCGIKKEAPPCETRRKKPHKHFKTNNFLIPKSIKSTIAFDESLTQYGHEDTLFARQLRESGVKINHIDNPVVHEGLEDADVFLSKTKSSLENAWTLYRDGKLNQGDIRAVDLYFKLRKARTGRAILRSLNAQESAMLRNLKSGKPSLYFFDLLKLIWLYRLDLQWSM